MLALSLYLACAILVSVLGYRLFVWLIVPRHHPERLTRYCGNCHDLAGLRPGHVYRASTAPNQDRVPDAYQVYLLPTDSHSLVAVSAGDRWPVHAK